MAFKGTYLIRPRRGRDARIPNVARTLSQKLKEEA